MNILDNIIIVLNRPQDVVNVGAVVRASKNMGFSRLRLVEAPPFDRENLLRLAHHAEEMVEQIAYYADLDDALADTIYVVGTADQGHPEHRQTHNIRALATDLTQRAAQGPIALLFGQEDDGLDRAALDRCHLLATLPTNPAYPTLNLAQAVLLFLYEVRLAAMGAPPQLQHKSTTPAHQDDLERLFQLSEAALGNLNFFKGNPAAVMRTLRQAAYRAELTAEEVALLMAIARKAG